MFNVDGSIRKTAKSKLLQSFSRLLEVPSAYISPFDMRLICICSLSAFPTSDDRDAKTRSETDYLLRD